MDKETKGYHGPNLHIVVTREFDLPSEYRWHVTMKALDATGARKLGYRASGRLGDTASLTFESGPQVHDEGRDVWTTMNDTDRPDIRKRIQSLVIFALGKLKESGKDKFEHLSK